MVNRVVAGLYLVGPFGTDRVLIAVDRPSCRDFTNTMPQAHKLDCESVSDNCRFIIQSENESEAIELAKKHMQDVHGKELSDDDLRQEHLQVV